MHSWDVGPSPFALSSLPPPLGPASRARSATPYLHPPPSSLRHTFRGIHPKEATTPPGVPRAPPGRLTGTVGWLQEQTTRTSLVSCSRPTDGADADSALPAELCIWSAYMVCICGLHMWSAHVVCKYGLHVWPTRRTCRQLERRHTITRVRGTMEGGMEVRNITPAALAIAMHAAPDGVPCPCAPTLECQQTRQGGRTWT